MRSGSRGYCTLLEDVRLVAMNTEASRDARHVTKPSGEERKTCFQAHGRRKRASSASVIWYTVLFRQENTDRPIGP